MKSKYFWIAAFCLLVGVVFFASLTRTRGVSAQAAAPTAQPQEQQGSQIVSDNDVNRVAKRLYCPVCPNTPLDVCETKACKDWREQIREQLSAGWSDQQVMDYFAQQYGERVLAEPERGGFNSLVWMLPVLVAGLGLVLVWVILRSWRKAQQAPPAAALQAAPTTAAVSQDVLAKIEAEIRKMD